MINDNEASANEKIYIYIYMYILALKIALLFFYSLKSATHGIKIQKFLQPQKIDQSYWPRWSVKGEWSVFRPHKIC